MVGAAAVPFLIGGVASASRRRHERRASQRSLLGCSPSLLAIAGFGKVPRASTARHSPGSCAFSHAAGFRLEQVVMAVGSTIETLSGALSQQ